MATKRGFNRRTEWVLTRPQPPATQFLQARFDSGVLRDPRKCDHGKARFTGDFWFCMECGEPVRDRDERRQATTDEMFTW